MFRFVCSCSRLFLTGSLILLTYNAYPQTINPVWTWHNDNNRTGRYLSETALTPSLVGTPGKFGLLRQWNTISGQVYAQPVAVPNLHTTNCPNGCNVVFIATEEDMLYAFDGDSPNSTLLWSIDLASKAVLNGQAGTYVHCQDLQPPCVGNGVISPSIGVTGTPVISTTQQNSAHPNILYVVTGVEFKFQSSITLGYYVHAIDITMGQEASSNSPYPITASAPGLPTPPARCGTGGGPPSDTVTFDVNCHLQRAGLLLLTINGFDNLYIGFTPVCGELENGWIIGYRYDPTSGSWTQIAQFVTTPYGTGGGIWGSGSGLAWDGTYIYVPTGNGTFDVAAPYPRSLDYGDSMLRLLVDNVSGALSVVDSFTPSDQSTRCAGDIDFGSGGVLLIPDIFYQGKNLMVSADKESQLYVVDRAHLGGYTPPPGPDQIVQEIKLPSAPPNTNPGYWSSPAYWRYDDQNGSHYQLYYAAEFDQEPTLTPFPINMYALSASGPIPNQPTASTSTVFCAHAPTPSISANGTTANSGILWTIENSNTNNPSQQNCNGITKQAVLHAYDATNFSSKELYNSSQVSSITAHATKFLPPTIFNDKVYVGTLGQPPDQNYHVAGEVDVFGLCPAPPATCKQ
jgi:hypothetical protein